ncbi:glycosyltransferase family 2 protein [Oerskovia turbata]|uniref:Glycosyltransferase family 2 protein n=1 Tax=Oerskovia turbata TaxID=1713 RepID=A0A4Q1KY15_9CELL|nr:glycosyltransferase [Oerskovia turbata]RXR26722.1 glycosyltransferase family 2 protein [Oerskovia turbata]RXR34419.1 glycosyltransferase family 2 protein [Oerskovia turbata]TGJ97734.1 glycosyltransferase family 2 protein [Actinotalea fermentans ATCC 43279 = JCM 9966 = DSM 3133]
MSISGSGEPRVLQRVVLPLKGDQDILPLYVEGPQGQPVVSIGSDDKERISHSGPAERQDIAQVLSRRSFRVKPGERTSFGTYFNAFPASYWRRWTVVDEVTLRLVVEGAGSVFVYRSNARGNIYRVASRAFSSQTRDEFTFELSLANFADGGWYWFDVVADGDAAGATLSSAQWESPIERPTGSVSISVTTLNRPDDILQLLEQVATDDALLNVLDRVLVVDQGTQHVTDLPGFEKAERGLDGRLRIIRQANLGGSGGFSRGMSEVLDADESDYVLLSDDDVRTEPEGILRAVTFADFARKPTIVGGHMFSMYDRAFLHSMGERIDPWRFWWGPAIAGSEGHHLNEAALRTSPKLHRRIDVDYNGWWMTLIPTSVLRKVGLSLPVFIKWDDAEYGLRARAAGVPTVTLPGAAVWHVPWTDKDDSLDWQAYYHQRNRVLAALLYSPFERGGRMVRESMYHQLKHLLAAQYSVAELRLQALEDLFTGPEHLHATLATKLAEIRATRASFDDSRVERDPGAFPALRSQSAKRGRDAVLPENRVTALVMAGLGLAKAVRPANPMSKEHPQAEIAAMDARWWLLSQYDSAVVSTSDGSGAAWYKRDPAVFKELLGRSIALHEKMLREWSTLSSTYRSALDDLVGQEAWKRTFDSTQQDES